MDQHLKRFEYLNEESKEALEKLKFNTIKELEEYERDLHDISISSQQKSEIYKDISHAKDLLFYLEYILGEKKSSKQI